MSHPQAAGVAPPSSTRPAATVGIRVLAVGGEPSLVQNIHDWAIDLCAQFEHACIRP